MARAETRARETGKVLRDGATPLVSDEVLSLPTKEGATPRARNMVPDARAARDGALRPPPDGRDGSTAIFWAMSLAVVLAAGIRWAADLHRARIYDIIMRGIGGLIPVLVLIMAFALGATTRELQAGEYLASLTEGTLSPILLPQCRP